MIDTIHVMATRRRTNSIMNAPPPPMSSRSSSRNREDDPASLRKSSRGVTASTSTVTSAQHSPNYQHRQQLKPHLLIPLSKSAPATPNQHHRPAKIKPPLPTTTTDTENLENEAESSTKNNDSVHYHHYLQTRAIPTPDNGFGFLTPYTAAKVSPDDRKDDILMAICSVLTSMGNRALCPKEIAETITERNYCELRSDTSHLVQSPATIISTHIRNHLRRAARVPRSPLVQKYQLTGSGSDLEASLLQYVGKKAGVSLVKNATVWYLTKDVTGMDGPYEMVGLDGPPPPEIEPESLARKRKRFSPQTKPSNLPSVLAVTVKQNDVTAVQDPKLPSTTGLKLRLKLSPTPQSTATDNVESHIPLSHRPHNNKLRHLAPLNTHRIQQHQSLLKSFPTIASAPIHISRSFSHQDLGSDIDIELNSPAPSPIVSVTPFGNSFNNDYPDPPIQDMHSSVSSYSSMSESDDDESASSDIGGDFHEAMLRASSPGVSTGFRNLLDSLDNLDSRISSIASTSSTPKANELKLSPPDFQHDSNEVKSELQVNIKPAMSSNSTNSTVESGNEGGFVEESCDRVSLEDAVLLTDGEMINQCDKSAVLDASNLWARRRAIALAIPSHSSDFRDLDLLGPECVGLEELDRAFGPTPTATPVCEGIPTGTFASALAFKVQAALHLPSPRQGSFSLRRRAGIHSTAPDIRTPLSTTMSPGKSSFNLDMEHLLASPATDHKSLSSVNRVHSVHPMVHLDAPISALVIDNLPVFVLNRKGFSLFRRVDSDYINLESLFSALGEKNVQKTYQVLSDLHINPVSVTTGRLQIQGRWAKLSDSKSIYGRYKQSHSPELNIFLASDLATKFPSPIADVRIEYTRSQTASGLYDNTEFGIMPTYIEATTISSGLNVSSTSDDHLEDPLPTPPLSVGHTSSVCAERSDSDSEINSPVMRRKTRSNSSMCSLNATPARLHNDENLISDQLVISFSDKEVEKDTSVSSSVKEPDQEEAKIDGGEDLDDGIGAIEEEEDENEDEDLSGKPARKIPRTKESGIRGRPKKMAASSRTRSSARSRKRPL